MAEARSFGVRTSFMLGQNSSGFGDGGVLLDGCEVIARWALGMFARDVEIDEHGFAIANFK